jgi:hypothetical protein
MRIAHKLSKVMKKALLTGIAALLMATSAVHAADFALRQEGQTLFYIIRDEIGFEKGWLTFKGWKGDPNRGTAQACKDHVNGVEKIDHNLYMVDVNCGTHKSMLQVELVGNTIRITNAENY